MHISAFLELAKRQSLVADLLNIETLHDLIEQVIPPITEKEHAYLETDKKLLEIYNQNVKFVVPEEGEPGLHFHEFIFLLGRIAIDTQDSAASSPELIEDFFVEKLNFKRKDTMPADDEYDEEYDSEDEMDQQQREFMAFLERKQAEDDAFNVDFDEILYVLDNDLPMVPGVPTVQPFPNPLLNKDKEAPIRVTFGKLMPKEKKDKDAKGKKGAAKKAQPKKKDEKPPPPIKWAEAKGPEPLTTLEHMRDAAKDLDQNVFAMNLKQESCNTGVMPTIIKEVFMPPCRDVPPHVATLIESSLVYQNSANYEMAIHSLEQAREQWREKERPKEEIKKEATINPLLAKQKTEAPKPVTLSNPVHELYFELTLGSIYESCGKDDIAIACYMRAKAIKLP